MPSSIGTRTQQNFRKERIDQGHEAASHTRDIGLAKNVTAAITFVNGATKQLQAANGTFAAFVVGDQILVEGTNLNNGRQIVTAIDAVNSAFLTVDPGPNNEGPIAATVRTI